jgi:hypothetical protein
VEPILSSWTTRHGVTARSRIWAIVNDDGSAIDLNDWYVRAQARESIDSDNVTFGFIVGHGIDIGSADVRLSTGRRVTTSTLQLYLLPADYTEIPRPWSGVIDIEIASDDTNAPAQRHTVVQLDLTVTKDVTR